MLRAGFTDAPLIVARPKWIAMRLKGMTSPAICGAFFVTARIARMKPSVPTASMMSAEVSVMPPWGAVMPFATTS